MGAGQLAIGGIRLLREIQADVGAVGQRLERVVRPKARSAKGRIAENRRDVQDVRSPGFGREAARNVGRGEAWKRDVTSGVILNRQGVWRSRMTPGQAWLVAQATRGARARFGFAQASAASLGSILSASVAEARVRFREARSSTGVVGAARHAGTVLKTLSAA